VLQKEIIAVCSENHAKHTDTLCGQKVQFLNGNPSGSYCTASTELDKVSKLQQREAEKQWL